MKRFYFALVALWLTMAVSAQDVTPLRTSPANNSTISALNSIWIYYDAEEVQDMYSSEEFKGKRYPVKNDKGEEVAKAYLINYEAPVAIIKIYPGVYAEGDYTLDLPEGYLWLYDNTVAENKQLSEPFHFTFHIDGTETRPTFDVVTDPAAGTEVPYLSTIKMSVPEKAAYGFENIDVDPITITNDADGSEVCKVNVTNSYGGDDGYGWWVLSPRTLIYEPGQYTVHIPDGYLKCADDWDVIVRTGEFDMLQATDLHYTVTGGDITPYQVQDFAGCSAANTIDITFPTHTTVAFANPAQYHSYDVRGKEGYWESYVRGNYDENSKEEGIQFAGNTITCPFASNMHYPNDYTFTIPAGHLVFEDGTTNTDLVVSFTLEAPHAVPYTSDPAEGNTVTSLSTLDITFTDAEMPRVIYEDYGFDVFDENGEYIKDEEGNDLFFVIDRYQGNTLKFRLCNGDDFGVYQKTGDITIKIPASSLLLDKAQSQTNAEILIHLTVDPAGTQHTYTTWGYYNEDTCSGLSALATQYETNHIAIFIPGETPFLGSKIAGVKIPVCTANSATSIKGWVAKSLTTPMTYEVSEEIGLPAYGYNSVYFTKSFTVPEGGCYIGYDITMPIPEESYDYPVIYDASQKADGGFYMQCGDYDWQDYSTDHGVSALQAIFEDFNLPEAYASIGTRNNSVTVVGTTQEWEFPVSSSSLEDITSLDYTLAVNGKTTTGTAAVNMPAGYEKEGSITLSITAPTDVTGDYSVVLTVDRLNGKDNQLKTSSTSVFTNVIRRVQRHSVMEENTGTECGYCPRGMVGMRELREKFGDNFIGMAFHRYSMADPMFVDYISASDIGIHSAPGANIDRKFPCDPYLGDDKMHKDFLILEQFAPFVETPALTDINLTTAYTDETKNTIDINVEMEALSDGQYELVYAVTADGLTSTSNVWNQHNYYYSDDPSEWPANLAQFCMGGELGTGTISIPFDDVIVASSYNSEGKNLGSNLGAMIAGEKKSATYTIAVPDRGSVRKAMDASGEIFVVVFALNQKGEIAQGAKVRVGEGTDGVDSVLAPMDAAARYDLSGRAVHAADKGQILISGGKKMMQR